MKRIIFIILFVATVFAAHSQVTIDQRVDTMQILIGEQTNLTLSATVRRGQKVQFPEFKPRQNIVPGLEVLEGLQADTVDMDGGMIKVTKAYTLTSFDENLYRIPSLNVKVDNKDYQTKALAVKVLTVSVDTVHVDKFYPPKDVQDNPFLWSEWEPALICSILFVLLILAAVYLIARLKSNKPVVGAIKIIKRLPPHQRAISDIEKLKAEKATVSENQKEYYTQLTTILRKYIAERFGFDAMEMTSTEIIERLRTEDNGVINEVVNLFRTADLVKFAKHSVLINENDANLMNALAFINDTKLEEKAPVHVVTIEEKRKKEANNKRLALKLAIVLTITVACAALAVAIYKACLLI